VRSVEYKAHVAAGKFPDAGVGKEELGNGGAHQNGFSAINAEDASLAKGESVDQEGST